MNAGGVSNACKSYEPVLRTGNSKSQITNHKQILVTKTQNSKAV